MLDPIKVPKFSIVVQRETHRRKKKIKKILEVYGAIRVSLS